jgi:hypothetical protein
VAGARFSRTMCGGAWIWIVKGRLGRGKLRFGSWVRAIQRRARRKGLWAKNRKPSVVGSVFANDVWGGLDLDSGRLIGEG